MDQERVARSGKSGPSRDELTIRWFTPRGRTAMRELLEDLQHAGGVHVASIVEDLRRVGVAAGVLDLRGINLRGEDLGGADLRGADLRGARLERANLSGANLDAAKLDWASLAGAKARGATFRSAKLRHADLTRTDMREADLEGAEIESALLRETELRRAWVKGVDFKTAILEEVDLTMVRRESYTPPATARHRTGIGAPPCSEPVPALQRFRTVGRPPTQPFTVQGPPTQRFTVQGPPTQRFTVQGPHARPFAPQSSRAGTFEQALAELLLSRDRVGRIAVTIDGVEVVLFEAEAVARLVA